VLPGGARAYYHHVVMHRRTIISIHVIYPSSGQSAKSRPCVAALVLS
jgi:hypothetical protein